MSLHSILVTYEGATYMVRLKFEIVNGYITAHVVSVQKVSFFQNPTLN